MSSYIIPKDPAEVHRNGQETRAFWAERDTRMRQDQECFEQKPLFTPPKEDRSRARPMQTNDLTVLIRQSAAMIASKPPRIKVIARNPQHDQIAQQEESFLQHWRRRQSKIYSYGIRNPLLYDKAQCLLLRGWLCELLMLDPENPSWPFRHKLLDPAHIYPCLGGSDPLYIAHVYQARYAELKTDWGSKVIEEIFPGGDDHYTTVEVTELFTPYEHCVVGDQKWIKKPVEHEYGFNPLHITTASGAFYRHVDTLASGDTQAWTKYTGTSIIEPVKIMAEEKEEILTYFKTIMARMALPSKVLRTSDEANASNIDTNIDGLSVIGQQDSLDFPYPPPIGQHMPLMQIVQDSLFAGGVTPQAMQDKPFSSGYERSIAGGSSRNMLWPFVRALEQHEECLYLSVLTLVQKFPGEPLGYTGQDPQDPDQRRAYYLDPHEMQGVDVYIEVEFQDVTIQDKATNANVAALLAREKLLSLDSIRRDLLGVDDTNTENTRVLSDLIWMNPMVSQLGAISASMQSSDPIVQQGAQLAWQQFQFQMAMQMMQQQQMMMKMLMGGGPGGPGKDKPPPKDSGMENSAQPDEEGQNAGLPPGQQMLGPSPSGPDDMGGI